MIAISRDASRERPSPSHAINIPQTRRSGAACPSQTNPYGVPVSYTHHPRTAGLLIAGLLLTGCGTSTPTPIGTAATPTEPPTASSAPAATPTPALEPDPSAANLPDDPVRLPWPAADSTAAAELQRSVDAGSEPWLLDPAEVAVSYATAAYGWTGAEAQPRPDGHTVDVAEGGQKLTVSLTQPGRAGAGGIWVVTAESKH
jgi:hypothetical protein